MMPRTYVVRWYGPVVPSRCGCGEPDCSDCRHPRREQFGREVLAWNKQEACAKVSVPSGGWLIGAERRDR